MQKTYLTCLALLFAAVPSVRAQAVINVVVDPTPVVRFNDFGTAASSSVAYQAAGSPTFVYDFGATPGTDTLSVTWSAPVGKQFVITAPANFTSAGLSFAVGGGSSWESFASLSDISIQFSNHSGGALNYSYGNNTLAAAASDPAFGFGGTYSLPLGTQVAFTSVTYTATVPDDFTQAFNAVPSNVSFFVSAYSDHATTNPGQWMTLEDAGGGAAAVPEPSTYAALSGATVLGFAMWRRRRATV